MVSASLAFSQCPSSGTAGSSCPELVGGQDAEFEEITALAADLCELPFAFMALKKEIRQGLQLNAETQAETAFLEMTLGADAHAGNDLSVVPDTLADERFASHRQALEAHGVRFLAGAPLAAETGDILGALWVLDVKPRHLSPLQSRALRGLARQASSLIGLKRQALDLKQAQESLIRTRAEQEKSERALRRSELEQRKLAEMLSAAQEAGKVGSWVVDANTLEAEWSEEAWRIYGITPGSVKPSFPSFFKRVHPDDQEEGGKVFQCSIASNQPQSYTHRMIMPDGEVRWLEHRWQAMPDEAGSPYQVLGVSLDVTERVQNEVRVKRLSQLYALSSGINAAIVRLADTQLLFEEACRLAVEEGGLVMSWVALKQQHSPTLQPVAASGKDRGYVGMMKISAGAEPKGAGPAGRAFQTNRPVCSNDIANDPTMSPWTEQALERGYRSCACFPLHCGTEVMGVYTVYADCANFFDAEEMAIFNTISENLSFAIEANLKEEERRKTQEILRASEARFRSYFEFSMHGIAIATPGKTFLEANDQLCSILGYGREELLSMSWVEITHPEDLAANLGQYKMLLEGKISRFEMEKRFIRKDGRVIWASIGVGCVRNPDGSIAFTLAVVLDIDKRKQAEEILREQATLLDKAQDAIMVRDLNDRILYWNKSAERLYGWSAQEAVGRSGEELLYRDPAEFRLARDKTITNGEWSGELQQWTKAGEPLTVEGRWTLIRSDDGKPKSVLTINTDITARKQLEQQFLRAQRMESLGTLAGGIAHDLNNVLAPVMLSVDLLRLGEMNQRRLDILNTVEASIKRGADMVKQVLQFARGTMGEQVEVNIGSLMAEMENIANETFMKAIQVSCQAAPGLWCVAGDATQLHQVLLNLCVNARDAMPDGGRLTLAASNVTLDAQYAGMNIEARPGPYVLVTVEDTGSGMPPEVIDRIFEPFFTTKETGKGTGLGLSTSTALVHSHGGFVRVDSEEGKGTKFSVYLPALTAEADRAGDGMKKDDLPRGHGELVLVVDDEAAVREITKQTLESCNYRVLTAADGVEAISACTGRKGEIAAVITDLMMPAMDGSTEIQILRHIDPGIRIIAASGVGTEAVVSRAISAGALTFLPKPYTAEALMKTVCEVLKGG